jgi:hypothetical protein
MNGTATGEGLGTTPGPAPPGLVVLALVADVVPAVR